MSRRDRTTGLPRARPTIRAEAPASARRFALSEQWVRLGILGAAVLLFLVVLGLLAYNWYDEHIGKPRAAVLTVGDSTVSLGYFADRLPAFALANASADPTVLVQSLLNKIEEEELTVALAKELGLAPTEEEVMQWIADSFGVPLGGKGSAFDTRYRSELRSTGLSDSSYRRLATANVANERLLEHFREVVGTDAELLTLRVVMVDSEEKAREIRERVEAGEDMGTLAQLESLDETTRQNDGLRNPEPLELLPEALRTELAEATPGAIVGPVEINDGFWLVRLERRERGELTEEQRTTLAERRLQDALAELRTRITVRRDLDPDEVEWALRHFELPAGS